MRNEFLDKTVIVTGAASGLGRAIAEEICRRGGQVVLADIQPKVEDLALQLRSNGARAEGMQVDVTDADHCQQLVDSTVARWGRLDFMFNNAGQGIVGELQDVDPRTWRGLSDLNCLGVYYGATAAYRVMIRQGFGHIVNTASVAGLVPFPGLSAYCVSKTAVVAFSRMLRLEGRQYGVRVTALCPGLIRTGIQQATQYLRVDGQELLARNPFPMMEVGPAALCCLRGVTRNQAQVVFPFHARALWWAYHCCPWLVESMMSRFFAQLRSLRMS